MGEMGQRVLFEITSPCSVTSGPGSTTPNGLASRPGQLDRRRGSADPPRPWNSCAGGPPRPAVTAAELALRPVDLPTGRSRSGALVRVRDQHDLLLVTAGPEQLPV
ncbi:hypothetical protein HBB16_09100 [Pseudonocardia sp. MCCB 268]|nr:hypothetical protein [Pseudonocardia cytotoxica]